MAPTLRRLTAVAVLLVLGACAEGDQDCPRCSTLVIAATGEPTALLPPLVGETVGRDVSDRIFERLAWLPAGASPLDSSALQPGLAVRWERVDSLTLRFHLRPGARWHDGTPVRASDVVFSFSAYADSTLDSQARLLLAGRVRAEAADDSTVLVRFSEAHPEQWLDATWHVRVLAEHIWGPVPTSQWAGDTSRARLVGSGRFRFSSWETGRSLTLERTEKAPDDAVQRLVWLFAPDMDAALNLLLSHEADLLESVGDSARVARVAADPALDTASYAAAVYGFLGFNLRNRAGPLADPAVRRALAQALDRDAAARSVFGPGAVPPDGPMSRILWINAPGRRPWSHDSAAAAQLLAGRGVRVDILVPGTSVTRRNLAQVIQEMWRRVGVAATITSVDFPVFQERLRAGRFQSFMGAWLDEPSPRQLADQWTSAGIGVVNYGHYRNPAFDSLFARAAGFRGSPAAAKAAWHEALDTLNADVPAIWLYNPTQVAGVSRRLGRIRIDAYSWLSGIAEWRLSREP